MRLSQPFDRPAEILSSWHYAMQLIHSITCYPPQSSWPAFGEPSLRLLGSCQGQVVSRKSRGCWRAAEQSRAEVFRSAPLAQWITPSPGGKGVIQEAAR